ncbi:MAG: HlyD family type I secretion periplasmic adaptor subunit [Magnetococcales bacterium]|nr:HlyD family type I secretion periplasmic adaptor subunit [Magnetococcales bacterium]
MSQADETAYVRELRLAVMRPPRLVASLLLFSIVIFVTWALIWAHYAVLDEVTTGQGKVIPSSQLKVIQNLEGGIVSEILVKEGDIVKQGQPLLRIAATRFQSSFQENKAKQLSFMAVAARLQGEIDQADPKFPDVVEKEAPELIRQEMDLRKARATELEGSISVLNRQKQQKQQTISEYRNRLSQYRRAKELITQELSIIRPLVERNAAPKIELLRLLKEKNANEGEINAASKGIQRSRSELQEIDQKIIQVRSTFQTNAITELNEVSVNLKALTEKLTGDADIIKRAEVLSPVLGTVKEIKLTTIGQVVQPGEPLMEIVPHDDSMMIEAKIRPGDIAFIHPGQKATVKITAFDYAIYGGLNGELTKIGADTVIDENGEGFYKITVSTKGFLHDKEGKPLPIIPGMIAEVDILTGQKTVLEYMMKPILRAQHKALRER